MSSHRNRKAGRHLNTMLQKYQDFNFKFKLQRSTYVALQGTLASDQR